jgi:hypothetical protein
MTIEELKKELDAYPDSLEVFITDETIGGKIAIELVSDACPTHGETPYVILVTNAYQGT